MLGHFWQEWAIEVECWRLSLSGMIEPGAGKWREGVIFNVLGIRYQLNTNEVSILNQCCIFRYYISKGSKNHSLIRILVPKAHLVTEAAVQHSGLCFPLPGCCLLVGKKQKASQVARIEQLLLHFWILKIMYFHEKSSRMELNEVKKKKKKKPISLSRGVAVTNIWWVFLLKGNKTVKAAFLWLTILWSILLFFFSCQYINRCNISNVHIKYHYPDNPCVAYSQQAIDEPLGCLKFSVTNNECHSEQSYVHILIFIVSFSSHTYVLVPICL